jgi:hypothetical protein
MGNWSDVASKSHIMRLKRFIGRALDARDATYGTATPGLSGLSIAMSFMVSDVSMCTHVGMCMDSRLGSVPLAVRAG